MTTRQRQRHNNSDNDNSDNDDSDEVTTMTTMTKMMTMQQWRRLVRWGNPRNLGTCWTVCECPICPHLA